MAEQTPAKFPRSSCLFLQSLSHTLQKSGDITSTSLLLNPDFLLSLLTSFHLLHSASQVDLAATLSALLGLPIPRQSVGRVLLPPLTLLSADEQLQVLEANAQQLRAAFDEISDDATRRDQLDLLYREAARMIDCFFFFFFFKTENRHHRDAIEWQTI